MPRRMVLMGVSGSGKTSVGEALAPAIGATYVDGDRLHPPENIAKMSAGVSLTDEDRWPWLAAVGHTLKEAPEPVIVGCSALRRVYRDVITREAGAPVLFIHLAGSQALIAGRMHLRTAHFMPTSLLDSQFRTLEPPGPDEYAIAVDIDAPLEAIVQSIRVRLEALPARA